MDSQYLKVLAILDNTKDQLERIFDKAEYKSFEDNKGYRILEKVIEQIQDGTTDLKHYSKDTLITGELYKMNNGKWAIDEENYFSCGYPVEIYNKDEQEWQAGRIENTNGEYYFYNYDSSNLDLYEGIKARIRT